MARGPLGITRSTLRASPPRTIAHACSGEAAPRGMGLPGFVVASRGASTRSFRAPMDTWRPSMATARRPATATFPAAASARSPVVAATRSEGNGWASRMRPATRPSDVDELAEVRDEVVDQSVAAVRDARAQPRPGGVEGDGGHDEVPAEVSAKCRRRAAAGSEHPFEFWLAELRRAPEVADHLHDAASLHDVAHELRGPRVELVVRLRREALAVLLRIR